jgi:hypothetical protein
LLSGRLTTPTTACHAVPRRPGSCPGGVLPVGKDGAIGFKLSGDRIMWVVGTAADPADNNRAFIYDVRTQRVRETAPVPAAKGVDSFAFAGLLADDSVVITGGDVRTRPTAFSPTATTPVATGRD